MHLFGRDDPKTAAEWFALRKAGPNADVERRFSEWIAASATNFEAYAVCELTWELAATAASDLTLSRKVAPWYQRRAIGAIAASLVLLTVVLSAFRLTAPRVTMCSTKPGEQRTWTLEDGSQVTLNTRSIAEVRMGWRKREVRMLQGEAFFDVAHDQSRPFSVETRFGTVRAVGTRFDVLLEQNRAEVSMEEGKVLVASAAGSEPPVVAVAGMRATLASGTARPTLDSADLNRVENWRAHRIEFDRVPLAAALTEFSRYTALPIRVQSPRTGQLEISAVMQTGDVSALESMLKGAFGLKIVRQQNEMVVVDQGK